MKLKKIRINGTDYEIDGASAYELYKEEHPDYTGTLEEWLASLKGEPGEPGKDGAGVELAPTLEGNEDDKAPCVSAVNKEITNLRTGVPAVDTIEEMTDTEKKYALSTDAYYVYVSSNREPSIVENIPFEEGKTLKTGGVVGDQSGSGTTDYVPVEVVSDDGVFVGFQLFTNENDGIFRNNTFPRFALYDEDKNCLSYRSGSATLTYVVETFDGVQYKGVWLSKSFFSYYGTEVIGAKYVRVTVATTTGDYKSHPHNFITAYKASWMRETPEWQSVPPYVPKMASETEAGLVRVWTTTNEDGTLDLHIDTTEQGA